MIRKQPNKMAEPEVVVPQALPYKQSVVDLKAALKALNQPVSGTKAELLARLVDAKVNGATVCDSNRFRKKF